LWRQTVELVQRAEVARRRQHLATAIEMLEIMEEELWAAHEMLSDKRGLK
jgi:hypothetical protein